MQRRRHSEWARRGSPSHSSPPSFTSAAPTLVVRTSRISLAIVLLTMLLSQTRGRATGETSSDGDVDDASVEARRLIPPTPNASADGEFESSEFWEEHGDLLRDAWSSFALGVGDTKSQRKELTPLLHRDGTGPKAAVGATAAVRRLEGVLRPEVVSALVHAHTDPTALAESSVRSLFEQVAPEVYKLVLFTPDGIAALRKHLDAATHSGIPTRRPNGMNRHGLIVDRDVDGAVSTPHLTSFVDSLVNEFVRPVGRMLFPSRVGRGDDTQHFAFTIRYREGEDVKLNEHSDASVVTMNVNLNLPGEGYGGSSVYFVDEGDTGERKTMVQFEPGVALIHRGAVRHGAAPISGDSSTTSRHNLIVWLFGEDGYVRVAPYPEGGGRLTLRERWGLEEPSCRRGRRGGSREVDCDEDGFLSSSGSAPFRKEL